AGGGARLSGDRVAAAELGEGGGERGGVDLARRGMEIEMALRELRQLGEAAGQRDALDRMAAQIFERGAGEIAHVDERDLGQAEEALHRRLRARAGRGRD